MYFALIFFFGIQGLVSNRGLGCFERGFRGSWDGHSFY